MDTHVGPMPRKAFNVQETAQALGLSRALVLRALHSGQLHGIRAGRRWLVSARAIDDYLAGGEGANEVDQR